MYHNKMQLQKLKLKKLKKKLWSERKWQNVFKGLDGIAQIFFEDERNYIWNTT